VSFIFVSFDVPICRLSRNSVSRKFYLNAEETLSALSLVSLYRKGLKGETDKAALICSVFKSFSLLQEFINKGNVDRCVQVTTTNATLNIRGAD
jgi:hypothetical protein